MMPTFLLKGPQYITHLESGSGSATCWLCDTSYLTSQLVSLSVKSCLSLAPYQKTPHLSTCCEVLQGKLVGNCLSLTEVSWVHRCQQRVWNSLLWFIMSVTAISELFQGCAASSAARGPAQLCCMAHLGMKDQQGAPVGAAHIVMY